MKTYENEIIVEYESKLRGVQYRIEEIINCVDTIGHGRELPELFKERARLMAVIENTKRGAK